MKNLMISKSSKPVQQIAHAKHIRNSLPNLSFEKAKEEPNFFEKTKIKNLQQSHKDKIVSSNF